MPGKEGKAQPIGIGMMPSRTELGEFVRARRLELNLRQVELSRLVGAGGNQTISSIEVGARKHLNDRQLERLAEALQCDAEELRRRMPIRFKAQPKTEPEKPSRRDRKPRIITVERETPLGRFVTVRRLELRLSQAQVAKGAGTTPAVISGIERGTYHPGARILKKVFDALGYEVPPFMPGLRGGVVRLSGADISALEKIKELSGIRATAAIHRAIRILRLLTEKKNDGYAVCLRKGKDIVELEFPF